MLTSSLNSLSTVQYICEKVCCIRSFILNDRFIVLDHAGQSVKDFKDTEISSHNPDRSDVRTGVDVTGTGPLVVCDINQTAKANMLSESAQKAADRLAVVGREGHSVIAPCVDDIIIPFPTFAWRKPISPIQRESVLQPARRATFVLLLNAMCEGTKAKCTTSDVMLTSPISPCD